MNSFDDFSDPDAEEKNGTISKQLALGGEHYLEAISKGRPSIWERPTSAPRLYCDSSLTVFFLRRSGTKGVAVADYGHTQRGRLKIDHDG